MEDIRLKDFSFEELMGFAKEASVVADNEPDDVINMVLSETKGKCLTVYTHDKDGGMGIKYKRDMTRSVTGRAPDYEIWMQNDYTKSAEETAAANRKILAGTGGETIRAFAESMRPTCERLGFAVLMVTAPTFGIVEAIHAHLGEPPMLVFAYTGSYNLAHMQDLVTLSKRTTGGAYIVDTSAFNVLGQGKVPGLKQLSSMSALFEGTSFWEDACVLAYEAFRTIRDFLLRFNMELVRPGRLMVPEYVGDPANEEEMAKLNAAYAKIDHNAPLVHLIPYLDLVRSPKYASAVKSFKWSMVQNIKALATDAPMCDLFIGVLSHLRHTDVYLTYGTWEVGRFSRVNPNGPRVNAVSWKLRCTREGARDEEIARMVERVRELVRGAIIGRKEKVVVPRTYRRGNKPLIILLNGPRGAGKDTVAGLLAERYFPDCGERFALADAVRLKYMKLHPDVTIEDLTDRTRKEAHRPGIIALAEAKRHEHGVDYWAKKLPIVTAEEGKTGYAYIISDWRFFEEYQYFSNMEGAKVITVRVDASRRAREERGIVYAPDIDESEGETTLDNFRFDHFIVNDTQSRAELTEALDRIDWRWAKDYYSF